MNNMLVIEQNDLNDTENPDEDHDFDWVADAGDVIVRPQPAVAVYTNPAGDVPVADVVLRQEGDPLSYGDSVVWFAVDHASAVAAAILKAAGLDGTAL